MWQDITEEQKKVFTECLSQGKPVVALHHSICAFDDCQNTGILSEENTFIKQQLSKA